MPTKVLIECPALIASVRVGPLAALQPLEAEGLVELRFQTTFEIRKEDIAWCDVLLSVRGSEQATENILLAAQYAERLTVYFLDDDLLHIPPKATTSGYFTKPFFRRAAMNCLSACDLLWCVNPHLADIYGAYPRQRTFLSSPPIRLQERPKRTKSGPLRVLYGGSVDHELLVRKYLSPAVLRLCKELGDAVSFTFIGPDPGLPRLPQVRHFPFFNNPKEYELLTKEGFNVGLAVIQDAPFYHGKYYNKYLEYTRIGAVGLYTDCDPYRLVVRQGENGFLTENDETAWYQALSKVLSMPREAREAVWETAWSQVEKTFSEPHTRADLLAKFPELLTFRAPTRAAEDIRLSSLRLAYYGTRVQELWSDHKLLFLPMLLFRFFRKAFRKLFRTNAGGYDD